MDCPEKPCLAIVFLSKKPCVWLTTETLAASTLTNRKAVAHGPEREMN